MFIRVQRVEEAAFSAEHLQNPVNPNDPMVLGFYRNFMSTIICSVYSKKASPIYWNSTTSKQIPRSKWTVEMKSYADESLNKVRSAPYTFKFSIVGYIFLMAVIGFFGYLVYDSLKPDTYVEQMPTALAEGIESGNKYFGHYMEKDPSTKINKKSGFGWFKIMEVSGSDLKVAKSVEMSIQHKPSGQMNSSDFESDIISMKKVSHESFQINLVSEDGNIEISLTEKKY